MRIVHYAEIVAQWKKDYGVNGRGAFRYSPAEVRASCVKCGKIRPKMSRHHICNDFFFALWMPHIYAKRYVEFRPTDCRKLCDNCHRNIERYSRRLKEALYLEFEEIGLENLTVEWCEKWRNKFRELFESWVKKPPRHKRRRRKNRR